MKVTLTRISKNKYYKAVNVGFSDIFQKVPVNLLYFQRQMIQGFPNSVACFLSMILNGFLSLVELCFLLPFTLTAHLSKFLTFRLPVSLTVQVRAPVQEIR